LPSGFSYLIISAMSCNLVVFAQFNNASGFEMLFVILLGGEVGDCTEPKMTKILLPKKKNFSESSWEAKKEIALTKKKGKTKGFVQLFIVF